jgi:hypothetical protein
VNVQLIAITSHVEKGLNQNVTIPSPETVWALTDVHFIGETCHQLYFSYMIC